MAGSPGRMTLANDSGRMKAYPEVILPAGCVRRWAAVSLSGPGPVVGSDLRAGIDPEAAARIA